MHAYALELIKDYASPGGMMLDIGSGSGYLTLCMALLMQRGTVIGIEHK